MPVYQEAEKGVTRQEKVITTRKGGQGGMSLKLGCFIELSLDVAKPGDKHELPASSKSLTRVLTRG